MWCVPKHMIYLFTYLHACILWRLIFHNQKTVEERTLLGKWPCSIFFKRYDAHNFFSWMQSIPFKWFIASYFIITDSHLFPFSPSLHISPIIKIAKNGLSEENIRFLWKTMCLPFTRLLKSRLEKGTENLLPSISNSLKYLLEFPS